MIIINIHYLCLSWVDIPRKQTSMAAFQSKLKGSSLPWYDPGHSVIITKFLLSFTLFPQILMPENTKTNTEE